MNRIGSSGCQYYQNWYIQTAGFPNRSVFITSRPQEMSCVRAPARKRVGSIQPPVPAKGMYLAGARKQETGTAVNMRGRLYGLIEDLIYQAARIAWAANRLLTNASGVQSMPRRARGFPMWTFLTINPRAGRNSRRYPRKFSSARCSAKPRAVAAWYSDQSELLPKADIGSGGRHVGFVPRGDWHLIYN